jgi:NADH dehydrogenase (ubiquinone) 1 beta subcomplex subunit 9
MAIIGPHATTFPQAIWFSRQLDLVLLFIRTTLRNLRYIFFPQTRVTIAHPSFGSMGSAASMHAARAAAWEEGITHAQRVTRLYRASLRTSRDWIIDYDLWLIDAAKIQARFRSNKDVSIVEGRNLVEKGMVELFGKRHPEPYIPIYMEGSSKYQRNVPPPPEVRERNLRSPLCPRPVRSLAIVWCVTLTKLCVCLYLRLYAIHLVNRAKHAAARTRDQIIRVSHIHSSERVELGPQIDIEDVVCAVSMRAHGS